MLKDSPDADLERVLWLVSNAKVGTPDLLDEVLHLCGRAGSAAVLWLYDTRYKDFYLDRVSGSHSEVYDNDIRRKWVPIETGGDSGKPLAPCHHSDLSSWCKKNGISTERVETLNLRLPGTRTPMGVLQVFSSRAIDKHRRMLLAALARALCRTIDSRRQERRLQAMRRIRAEPDLRRAANLWFQRAAEIAQELLAGELCLFFRMSEDSRFQCCAAADAGGGIDVAPFIAGHHSLTRVVAEKALKNVRIRNFQDCDELQTVFGQSDFDENLVRAVSAAVPSGQVNTVIMMPVIVEEHTFAVAMVLNKTKQFALRFSETDRSILKAICEFLSGVIPGSETYSAMRGLVNVSFDGSLERDDTKQHFHKWLRESIPGIVNSALLIESTHEATAELIQLGGNPWFKGPSEISGRSITTLPDSSGKKLCVTKKVPKLGEHKVRLVLGLQRGYISDYEVSLVEFACSELSHMLRAEQMVQEQKEALVQIRHVVRAGLSGIMCVQVAQQMYERIVHRRQGKTSELTGARFRRNLAIADEYSRRTNNLLEETRFLLGQITTDKLRLGQHSATQLLKDIQRCLARYAKRRRIDLSFDNRVPHNQSIVTIDSDLVEIAVFNLLDNAIKYSFRGKRVTMTARIKADNWIVEFKDFGVYIPMSDNKAIFERFVRKTSTQTAARRRPGTGLGLPVAQEIAVAHGGAVWCTSESWGPNEPAETTFFLSLPRHSTTNKRENK